MAWGQYGFADEIRMEALPSSQLADRPAVVVYSPITECLWAQLTTNTGEEANDVFDADDMIAPFGDVDVSPPPLHFGVHDI